MSLLSNAPFRIFLLLTFFVVLITGFAWYTATLQYERDTAHLHFVDPENPLWNQAKAQAKANLDTLYALYPQYPNSSYVKFSHKGASGLQEDIWAQVTDLGPGFAQIEIERQYLIEKDGNPAMELPAGQIIDWMVILPNGNIRGGYTTQAILLLTQDQSNTPSDSLEASLKLFVDTLVR